MKMQLPQVQVLVYEPRIGCSMWMDYESRARTFNGLVKDLQKRVRDGEYVGYRLMHVYCERRGIVPAPIESELRKATQ